MRRLLCLAVVMLMSSAFLHAAPSDPPLLLRFPTVSKTQIVFNYAGDLWIVSRDGGDARRLTSGIGTEALPYFSPDGSMIAFTGEYDGNLDVYVVPAAGGVPRRLTYHPAEEYVAGWTPDGKKILFNSWGNSFMHFEDQLYTVPVDGGFPTALPLPIAEDASFSPDGSHIAYVPHPKWQQAWKRYHGGQTTPIWIADLKDSSIVKVPRENSNDHHPMWVGDTIYFLSDRNGPVSLFAYDTKTKQVTEALHSDGLDFKTASAGPDAIVIEQFGAIKLYDLQSHQAKNISIHVEGDLEAVRPHFAKVEPKRIQNFSISPTGARAVFEAWGEIFTVPTDKGDIRNLTHSPAVADRDPTWSPDGKSIAYFTDESGEYELAIRDQNGLGTVRHINLGNPPSFFYTPTWSPDSKKIAYTDKRLQLWYLDLDNPAPKLIDTDYFWTFAPNTSAKPGRPITSGSPTSSQLPSGLHAVFVYSLDQGKTFQVTDGMSDALNPASTRTASISTSQLQPISRWPPRASTCRATNIASRAASTSRCSARTRSRRSLPKATKRKPKDEKKPDQDKDKDKAKDQPTRRTKRKTSTKPARQRQPTKAKTTKTKIKTKDKKDEAVVVKIDIDGIGQRILSLPIPAKNYLNMLPGKSGILFLAEGPMVTEETRPNVRARPSRSSISASARSTRCWKT